MRSLNKDHALERAMDEAVSLFMTGKDAMRIKPIADGMGENEFDVRRSLMRLVDRGVVVKVYLRQATPPDFYYERAHGGYSPGPGDAA